MAMRVYVLKVDKDLCFFDVEGYRFWGELRKGKKNYLLLNERKQVLLEIPAYYGEKLHKFIEKEKNGYGEAVSSC